MPSDSLARRRRRLSIFERHDAENTNQGANAKADHETKQVNVHSPHFPSRFVILSLSCLRPKWFKLNPCDLRAH